MFEPITIGNVELRNRTYMGPHGIPLEAPTPGHEFYHSPAVEAAYYYAERAHGGVGLIFHSQQSGPVARFPWFSSNPWFRESIPSYRRVAEMVHEGGAKIMSQLWYTGNFLNQWDAIGPVSPVLRPSHEAHFVWHTVGREMTKAEIQRLIETYVQSSRHLLEAGYDGVEIHASHGAIVEKFLSPYFNKRTDEYGGSLENRMRFLTETLERVRDEVGTGLALGTRICADQLLEGAVDLEETKEILRRLDASGLLDFIDIDIGVEPEQQELMATSAFMPKLHNAERVAALREAAGSLTVLSCPGQLADLADAENLLAAGSVDMVGAVRGLIAEPELIKNALEGKEAESRRCLLVNQCIEAAAGLGFGCAVNPASGREEKWGVGVRRPAPRSMKVVVVGGGPAGGEAARVAALRGHEVVLFEARDELGGGMALWSKIPGRERVASTPRWYADRLAELDVDVRLSTKATKDSVLAEGADVVVTATGALYATGGQTGLRPGTLSGSEQDFVVTLEDILLHGQRLSGRVVVLDEEGLHAASGVAQLLAEEGAEVELVTRRPMTAETLNTAESSFVRRKLREAGVKSSTLTSIEFVGDQSVTLMDFEAAQTREVEVDWVVLATTRRPVDDLYRSLDGAVPFVYLVGDALAPRRLRDATYEAHRFAHAIGEPDMPASVQEEIFRPVEELRPAEFAGRSAAEVAG